jgi:hypothetical protein
MKTRNLLAAAMITANFVYLGVKLSMHSAWLDAWRFSLADQIVQMVLLVGAWTGAVLLMIDAFQRQYRSHREEAIALTVVGLLTAGLTSLAYFLIWGRQGPSADYATEFCAACLAGSRECESLPNLTTVNYVHGGRLVGAADRCPNCGSVVRTHAFYLAGIPLYSLGSFRVIVPDRDAFFMRRVDFHWPHLVNISILPLLAVAILLLLWSAG